MNKIFSKLGVIGLLSFLLLSFTQTGMSNEVFDITKETVLVAEQDVLVVEAAVEEVPTINSGDTAWMIVATILSHRHGHSWFGIILWWLSKI